jgi:CheY-like chemotaxis protein/anti-sigma regulatory factor (Ser/Thr protein kinase)
VLNLLSRVETYLALTDVAATHAREALDLSTRTGDRIGQAEARIDAGKLELFPSEIDLAVFLQIVCDTIQERAEDKGLRFVFDAAADLPGTVRVDEKRLRQVLLNLLSNAVKFTDVGQVTLRVTRVAPPVGSESDYRLHLRFEIEDNGIGMSERELARVFQPFEQVADARRREGGAGLGLAISRQLLHLMGGEIRVRSRPGEGSVFWFEIETPTIQEQVPVRSEPGVPIGYPGKRRRILVTDDAPANRAVLVGMLGALDFQIAEAANGWDTLKEVARSSPDLVLIDLAMPLMDGWETIRSLRRTTAGAEVPVIATSASATPEVESSSRAAGANAFVGRPIQEAALLQVIATLLQLEWLREGPKEQLDES